MKILISGHTSAIGRKFASFAISQGHEVVALGSDFHPTWRLGESLPNGTQAEGFVHFAHDRSRSLLDTKNDINLILKDFRGHPVLISTVSAHQRSKSRYGKSKYIAEDLFLRQGGAVLKSGLIVDDIENRFMTLLENLSQKFPVILLPFMGKSTFYFTSSNSLLKEIEFTLFSQRSGTIRTFCLHPCSMERIVKSFHYDKKRLFVGVPSFFSKHVILALGKLFPRSNLLDSLKSLVVEMSLTELNALESPKFDFSLSPSLTKKLFI